MGIVFSSIDRQDDIPDATEELSSLEAYISPGAGEKDTLVSELGSSQMHLLRGQPGRSLTESRSICFVNLANHRLEWVGSNPPASPVSSYEVQVSGANRSIFVNIPLDRPPNYDSMTGIYSGLAVFVSPAN